MQRRDEPPLVIRYQPDRRVLHRAAHLVHLAGGGEHRFTEFSGPSGRAFNDARDLRRLLPRQQC